MRIVEGTGLDLLNFKEMFGSKAAKQIIVILILFYNPTY